MTEKTFEMEKSEPRNGEIAEETFPRRTVTPRVDIYETDEKFVVVLNMPGVTEENVDLTLEHDQLLVVGEVKQEAMPGYRLVYGEQFVRSYKRSFRLNDKVDSDSIEATLSRGVLTLTLTKAPIARVRQIPVQAAS